MNAAYSKDAVCLPRLCSHFLNLLVVLCRLFVWPSASIVGKVQ